MNKTSTNILFVNHRLDALGGIETRWIDEFQYLNKYNYQVYLLTNERAFDSDIAKLFTTCDFITIDIENPSIATEFIRLVDYIVETVDRNNIKVISIHMLDLFACAAVMAAQLCRIPVISTIHGTPDIYRSPFNRLFIQNLTGYSFSLSISVSKHLEGIFSSQAPLTKIIPNLINLDIYQHQTNNIAPAWLLISRISSEKYESILRFLQAANSCNIDTIDIAGGGDQLELRKRINALNIKTQVRFLGEIKDIAELIPKYLGVAGMGRVAIEGLACKKPVCIISPEGSLIGLVTIHNFTRLKSYNFTGKGLVSIDNQELSKQLEHHTIEHSQHIYQKLKHELSVNNWDKYIKLYEKILFIDNPALESLYHKLAYFAVTLSRPFEKDDFFWHLFYETLIEYKLDNIKEMYHYYENSIGLTSDYPNPYKTSKNIKWRDRFK